MDPQASLVFNQVSQKKRQKATHSVHGGFARPASGWPSSLRFVLVGVLSPPLTVAIESVGCGSWHVNWCPGWVCWLSSTSHMELWPEKQWMALLFLDPRFFMSSQHASLPKIQSYIRSRPFLYWTPLFLLKSFSPLFLSLSPSFLSLLHTDTQRSVHAHVCTQTHSFPSH